MTTRSTDEHHDRATARTRDGGNKRGAKTRDKKKGGKKRAWEWSPPIDKRDEGARSAGPRKSSGGPRDTRRTGRTDNRATGGSGRSDSRGGTSQGYRSDRGYGSGGASRHTTENRQRDGGGSRPNHWHSESRDRNRDGDRDRNRYSKPGRSDRDRDRPPSRSHDRDRRPTGRGRYPRDDRNDRRDRDGRDGHGRDRARDSGNDRGGYRPDGDRSRSRDRFGYRGGPPRDRDRDRSRPRGRFDNRNGGRDRDRGGFRDRDRDRSRRGPRDDRRGPGRGDSGDGRGRYGSRDGGGRRDFRGNRDSRDGRDRSRGPDRGGYRDDRNGGGRFNRSRGPRRDRDFDRGDRRDGFREVGHVADSAIDSARSLDPTLQLPPMQLSKRQQRRTLAEWPDHELVRAFLFAPLDDLAQLSAYGRVPRPRFNLKIGRHAADAYLESYYAGYVGTVLIRSFISLLRKEGELWTKLESWPYNGSGWKVGGLAAFHALPEIGRTVRYLCERGESVYHIRSYLWALRRIWMEMDGKRPSRWKLEEVLHLLAHRWVSGRGSMQYPLSAFAALWNRERPESGLARTGSQFRRLLREAIRDVVRTAAKNAGYAPILRPKTAGEKARARELARMGFSSGGGDGGGGGRFDRGGPRRGPPRRQSGNNNNYGGPRRRNGRDQRPKRRARPNARQRAKAQARLTF